jgi:hypothetical protein
MERAIEKLDALQKKLLAMNVLEEYSACIVLMTPAYHPKEPVIEPMFEYPSELHLGELKRNN